MGKKSDWSGALIDGGQAKILPLTYLTQDSIRKARSTSGSSFRRLNGASGFSLCSQTG